MTARKLYDSETNAKLTRKDLGITREQYDAIVADSEGIAGEGHTRPEELRGTAHPRVYAA